MFDKLKAPFDPAKISWRVGSMSKDKSKGMALAYIDARDVMERLDEVCGPAGWQNRYPHANGKTVCAIGIKIGDEWVWKEDGAGDSDIEAEKGALSDAFKRAAVRWGIGRYLYDLSSPWVQLDEYKHIVPSEMQKLQRLLGAAQAPKPVALVEVTSGPAKPKEAAISSAAIGFAREMKSCLTLQDLDAFKRTPEFRSAWGEMNEVDRKHIVATGEQLRAKLTVSDILMAGE